MTHFRLNRKTYATDDQTAELLRDLEPKKKPAKGPSALLAVFNLGLRTGRIVEVMA